MHIPSRVLVGRVALLIGAVVFVGVAIAVASQSSSVARGLCGQGIVPDSLLGNLCVSVPDTQFPSGTADQAPSSFNTPVARGIVCPATAKPGVPVAISWSCGSSALFAVAGFSLSDKTQMSATVVPSPANDVFGIKCADGYESVCSINTVNPQVRIWSDPARVRLGARANIFWSTSDVQSCHVTGPSFDDVGVSGGAATVPITTATIFTATCQTLASTTVSASVRVDFAQ